MAKHPLLLYSILLFFILGWWVLAFKDSFWISKKKIELPLISNEFTLAIKPSHSLSSLSRDTLVQALRGNFDLMAKKIVEWDIDATLLESLGIQNIRHLPPQIVLKSHFLLRKINSSQPISKSVKFLPQTYASADFLLTLINPEAIAALPKGFRHNTDLYPPNITSKIPLNIDRYETEKLLLTRPTLAFASALYSDPLMIQSLKNQNIPIVYTSSISTLQDMQNSLMLVGNTIGKKNEAELLCIFIDSCLAAIENRLLAAKSPNQLSKIKEKTLYLCYNTRFQLISPQTLVYFLLNRLGVTLKQFPAEKKSYLTQEDLLQINPPYLLLSSHHPSEIHSLLSEYPALESLRAINNRNLFWVDDAIQQFPTHHILLAYFDIANALANMKVDDE